MNADRSSPRRRGVDCVDQLSRLLWECPIVEDRDSRGTVFNFLQWELGDSLVRREHLRGWSEVVDLARQCCQEESDAFLRALDRVIGMLERDSAPSQRLRGYINILLDPGIFGAELLDALRAILPVDAVPDELCLDLYVRSVGPSELPEDVAGVRDAVDKLADLPVQEGGAFPYPVIAFVERLARHVDASTAAALRRWVGRAAEAQEIPPARLDELVTQVDGEKVGPPSRPCLMIVLEPSAADVDRETRRRRYDLRMWLFEGNDLLATRFLPGGLERTSLSRVEDELDRWCTLLPKVLRETMTELIIEVFLPRTMMNLPVDQWKLSTVRDLRIGEQHRVVIRGLDRLREGTALPFHLRKWRQLSAWRPAGGIPPISWIRGDTDPKRLFLDFQQDHCLGLGLHFRPRRVAPSRDLLDVGLRAGAPLALWIRHPLERDTLQRLEDELQQRFTRSGISDVPGVVRDLRASSEWEHVGSHLALLWDDPNRSPPDEPVLQSPLPIQGVSP